MKRFLIVPLFLLMGCIPINGKENLERIYIFDVDQVGYASISNVDDTLLVAYRNINNEGRGIFWIKEQKKIKNIEKLELSRARISPDGNFYSYMIDNEIFINNNKDIIIARISPQDFVESVVWAYDSKNIYICERGTLDIIYSYNINTKVKKEILRSRIESQYFHLVAVINSNVIYLLENQTPGDPIPECDILQYDISKKKLTKIDLPILTNFGITTDFTISPDEKIIIFNNIFDGKRYMYVIDKTKVKIIDKINTDLNGQTAEDFWYSWKADSTYVVFTMDYKNIYRYSIPKY